MHTVPAFSRADAQHHPRPYERSDDGRRRDGAALGRDDRRMEGIGGAALTRRRGLPAHDDTDMRFCSE